MATAGTRADIRQSIRSKIQCFPDQQTTFSVAVLAADLTVNLASLTGISDRALLECQDAVPGEILQVQGLASSPANPITVIRGAQGGPVAAGHLINSSVFVYPFWGWTDQALNKYVTKAIQWMGQSMVWTLKPYTNTWIAGSREFGLPAGCVYPTGDIVKKVEYQDPNTGLYSEILGWQQRGDRIIVNIYLRVNWNVRIWVQTKQAVLTDDTTVIDTDYAQEAIELYSAGRILEELVGNRSRYYDYSSSLNDRASTLDELQRTAYYYFNQATILADKISRPGLAGYAPIQRAW